MEAVCKYEVELLTEPELKKVEKMTANGTSYTGAVKTRWALRRKRRVLKVEERE